MRHWFDPKTESIFCEPDCVEEWLDSIWELGADYDGRHSAEDLKHLIDNLVYNAKQARECLYNNKLFVNEDEWENSLNKVIAEKEKYLKQKV